jgi:hypothetical protein
VALLFSCAHINYVGKSFTPSQKVDLFYSKDEIKKDYTVMGHAIGAGQMFVSEEHLQEKLVEEAKEKGADAVLITGIDRDIEEDDAGFDAEKQIKAQFLKYINAE